MFQPFEVLPAENGYIIRIQTYNRDMLVPSGQDVFVFNTADQVFEWLYKHTVKFPDPNLPKDEL